MWNLVAELVNPNNMIQAYLSCFVLSAGLAVVIHHLLHKYGLAKAQHVLHEGRPAPEKSTPQSPCVRLSQVYPFEEEIETDVDIIAIHGLDTKSPETWTWVDRHHPDQLRANWIQDLNMLPSKAPRARIFTCDWPAAIFETSDLVQMTFEELARLLLAGIEGRPSVANDRACKEGRPIFFIASCLGGVILMKTLVMARDSKSTLTKATRAAVFLSTPFRGTSFQDVANWAEPGLTAFAWFQGKKVTSLLGSLKKSTLALDGLVGSFTQLCQDHRYQVFTFYEKGYTSLYGKVFPWVPDQFLPAQKPLVDGSSATLDIVRNPLPLNRRHVMMNKFSGPHDPDYQKVVQKIEEFLRKIKEGTPIERADALIREGHYTADKLKIERLSGQTLSMNQCYINLAIVEQPYEYAQTPMGESPQGSEGENAAPHSCPFSLRARLKIETPIKETQVELSAIFNPRKGQDGHTIQPRRVWIQGRAGVGKTTLCKKIVHDFKHDGMWQDLFKRVLWIPLRNLKQRMRGGRYGLEELFLDEYFPCDGKNGDLARALQDVCNEPDGGRSLFLLDGLDEIWHELSPESDMYRFIVYLLRQPNVIVTSRPSVTPPGDSFDLELETVGFYPHQVTEYVQKVAPDNARDIQNFLGIRPLLRDLVRIPIQLDAVCYAWKNVYASAPETMTDLYMAIQRGLAQKDVSRLEKRIGHRPTHPNDSLTPDEAEYLMKDETDVIAGLAFTGLYNNVIVFDAKCRASVSRHFGQGGTTINHTLRRLSYLRPSDPQASEHDRTYHFLHLTLQEYFAARYFFKKWTAGEVIKCLSLRNGKVHQRDPASFLQQHKYSARYDIFWRFVAGLLSAADSDDRKKLPRFFDTIQQEPLDLLGFAHQRMIMHCLNEVHRSRPFAARRELEEHLSKWLVLQCRLLIKWKRAVERFVTLASEIECPEQAIVNVLQKEDDQVRSLVLCSMRSRHQIPLRVMRITTSWLRGNISAKLAYDVLCLFEHLKDRLPVDTLNAMAMRLEDQYAFVRLAAVRALECQWVLPEAILPEGIINQIRARTKDQDEYVRVLAYGAVHLRHRLPQTPYQHRAGPEAQVPSVRNAAIIPPQVKSYRQGMASRPLKVQDAHLRRAATPRGQSDLPEEPVDQIAARLKDQGPDVRRASNSAVRVRWSLQIIAARLEKRRAPSKGPFTMPRPDPDEKILWPSQLTGNEPKDKDFKDKNSIAQMAELAQKDRVPELRMATIRALQGPSRQKVAQIELQSEQFRMAASDVLQDQLTLPGRLLNLVMALLEDYDQELRSAAIDVLRGQSRLPKGVVKQIVLLLNDGHYRIDMHAELISMLLPRQEFHSSCLVGGQAQESFLPLLLHSFGNHLVWYIKPGKSYIETENHVGMVESWHPLVDLEGAIQRARKEAGVPAVALGHGFG